MLRTFRVISAVFALGFWALAPNAASAGEGHRGYDEGRYHKDKYNKGGYERDDDRDDRRREYRP